MGWRGLAPFLPIGPRERPRLADSFFAPGSGARGIPRVARPAIRRVAAMRGKERGPRRLSPALRGGKGIAGSPRAPTEGANVPTDPRPTTCCRAPSRFFSFTRASARPRESRERTPTTSQHCGGCAPPLPVCAHTGHSFHLRPPTRRHSLPFAAPLRPCTARDVVARDCVSSSQRGERGEP